MAKIEAERFLALKVRIKAEMLRRCQSGSVAAYGGSDYDYATPPATGGTVKIEHRDKLTAPLSAVNADVTAGGSETVKESEVAHWEAHTALLEARGLTDRSGTDCQSGCTGTCYSGCDTGCYGCSGSCEGGCEKGCDTTCEDTCEGKCTEACTRTCYDDCDSGCWAACSDSCTLTCYGCSDTCEDGCQDGCANICTGTCVGTCYNTAM